MKTQVNTDVVTIRGFSAEDTQRLWNALDDHLNNETGVFDWGGGPPGIGASSPPPPCNPWDTVPEIASKAVARAAPIFKEILGIKLDVNWIKKGGYMSITEFRKEIAKKIEENHPQKHGAK